MKFVNLTPHTINEVNTGLAIGPSGTVARVNSTTERTGEEVNNVPFYRVSFGEVEGLPEPKEDTFFIVSGMVLDSLKGSRMDVVAPGMLIRDEEGKPIGCDGFRVGY
jgi:hypothetical protein